MATVKYTRFLFHDINKSFSNKVVWSVMTISE